MAMDVALQPPGNDPRAQYLAGYIDCETFISLRLGTKGEENNVSVHFHTAAQCDKVLEVLTEMRRTLHRRALAAQREGVH